MVSLSNKCEECFFSWWLNLKIFIWLPLKVYPLHLRACSNLIVPYTVWNRRLGNAMRIFFLLYLSSPLPKISMFPFYLFIVQVWVLFYSFCMLMIWLSLVLILLPFSDLNNSYKPHFIWKILATCIIFVKSTTSDNIRNHNTHIIGLFRLQFGLR